MGYVMSSVSNPQRRATVRWTGVDLVLHRLLTTLLLRSPMGIPPRRSSRLSLSTLCTYSGNPHPTHTPPCLGTPFRELPRRPGCRGFGSAEGAERRLCDQRPSPLVVSLSSFAQSRWRTFERVLMAYIPGAYLLVAARSVCMDAGVGVYYAGRSIKADL